MSAFKQPCGCVFDPELVDPVHYDEGQPHKLKADAKKVIVIPEVPEAEKAGFLEKVLPKSKKSKDGD